MSTNLKNYVIELINEKKCLITAEKYSISNLGIITYENNNTPIASFAANTWSNCYEITTPSIIYSYEESMSIINHSALNNLTSNESVETTQNFVEKSVELLPVENIQEKTESSVTETIVVHSNLVPDEIVEEEVLESLEKDNSENLVDKTDVDTGVSFNPNIVSDSELSFFKKEVTPTINSRDKIINQLDNSYLTDSERKSRNKKNENNTSNNISDFYLDIGREPINVHQKSVNTEDDTIEEGEDDVDVQDNDAILKLLLEGDSQPSSIPVDNTSMEMENFDQDPIAALSNIDFTIKQDTNSSEDPLAALDDMVDSNETNSSEDPLAALDDMVDSSDVNSSEDPLAALDDMVDSNETNSSEDPLAALDDMVDSNETNSSEDPLAALDDMVDSNETNSSEDPLAALDDIVDSEQTNPSEDPLAALDDIVDSEQTNPSEDPLAALDDMVDSNEVKTKEYETIEDFDKDENIEQDDDAPFEENSSADVSYNEDTSLEALLSKLPSDDNKYEASYQNSSREIRRVPSPEKDLDVLNTLIDKKNKEAPSSEFRNEPEPIEVQKPVESYQLRNSQGRLLTPQELKIKKEKIIEQTVFQYCSKFPKFNSKHLSEILSKNPKALAYKITEDDIIWVASKMIRSASIQAKFFIREQEQKKLSHFLPSIIGKHWDNSISNLSSIIKDIPQLSTSNIMDLSVWLLENEHI